MVVIFTYRRFEMLTNLLSELKGERIIVIDDGSDYDPTPLLDHCTYYRYPHQGKEGFWRLWDEALRLCKGSRWVLFLQDDVTGVKLDEIKRITANLDLYAFNIMRRGADRGWTTITPKPVTIEGTECTTSSFVDCIFCTNGKTLDLLEWKMNPVPMYRFIANPAISSGVGQQLSRRFQKLNVPMITPIKSLATHGNHKSLMHPEERQKNPLVSL